MQRITRQHSTSTSKTKLINQTTTQGQLRLNQNQQLPIISNNISQSSFYDTLRTYAQRLKQQRDASLSYLQKINRLSEEIRTKDLQIGRLNKSNKQLLEKVQLYESVLNKSRIRNNSLRMSTVIDKSNMTQSMIQITVEESQMIPNHVYQPQKSNLKTKLKEEVKDFDNKRDKFQLFEQFFIVTPDSTGQGLQYKFQLQQNSNIIDECIKLYVQHEQFKIKSYQASNTKTTKIEIIFISDSPYTTLKQSKRPQIPLNQQNLSLYYFGFAILHKDLVNVNGKYCWVPSVYGFVTFYPFSEMFLNIVQGIIRDYGQTKDSKMLYDMLIGINQSFNSLVMKNGKQGYALMLPNQIKYNNFNKICYLKFPSSPSTLSFAYSKVIFQDYAAELIVDVLMLLLLQIPITIISTNSQLLSKFMLYFVCLLKPLKYPFPIVFNLPPSMEVLLQSPFPTFIGCKNIEIVDNYMNQRAVFDLDKKIAKSWPILQYLDPSRQYLMGLIQKKNGDIERSGIIEELLMGKNVKQLHGYWKDFSKTQIYQNYMCEH